MKSFIKFSIKIDAKKKVALLAQLFLIYSSTIIISFSSIHIE